MGKNDQQLLQSYGLGRKDGGNNLLIVLSYHENDLEYSPADIDISGPAMIQ